MNAQIALGNLAAQPNDATFVDRTFITPAPAMK
jgi:hypothetical protein